MVRPSLHELQYSASPRRHDVITKDRTTQPSQRSITAATRKGSAVRTTHRIQSTSQHLTFSRYLNASAPLDWSSSEWFCRGSNLSGMCRCARVSRRSAGTLSVNTTAQLSAVSSATRIYVRLGGTDYIPAIQRRLLHNQAGLRPGALSLIDPNPEGYIIHYS